MTDCVYFFFLLYLALGKLSLMLLINYITIMTFQLIIDWSSTDMCHTVLEDDTIHALSCISKLFQHFVDILYAGIDKPKGSFNG